MELFQTDLHYIIQQGDYSLWCNRSNGKLEPKSGVELANAWNPVCLGQVHGIIGKVKLHPDSEWRLILIKQRSLACQLASVHNIYKINKIAILPLTTNDTVTDLDLEPCKKHHFGMKNKEKMSQSNDGNQISLRGTWNSIKTAAENVKTKKKENKDKEKFEKRILEELLKMYNDSDFFYYSDDYDITNSVQRQNSSTYDKTKPLWKRADERFFWNKHMLLELMEENTPLADPWLQPVIQGYVQMEHCLMDFEEEFKSISTSDLSSSVDRKLEPLGYQISLISRRSRHRAGTRSRKRGINSSGACANYVETEQIIEFSPHLVSFVQVRGSIPVFWSQSGFKYRPPPRLDKDEEASHEAFTKHFEEQLGLFSKMTIVSLAELAGKEQVLGDAYLLHVLRYNSPDITYVTFDFHEYCRGMRFENVSILTEGIKDIIKDMRYCWVDNKGVICEQRSVLRVNCVDCLDRTNVVMTAVARIVMETQFRKLGLLPPEENLPKSCRLSYQQIWANNGDAISRQYAGTAALKGDYTRTGERKISGLMKDGMNSANRYYLRFRDAHRQAAIDLTLGQPISEALLVPSIDVDEVDGNDIAEKVENVKMMIEDCKRMLIVEPEHCLGGWALINADSVRGDSDRQDMDIILLLSQRSVYVAWYDDEEEQVTQYQRIYLEDVDRIEIGMEPAMFKPRFLCLRLVYHYQADEGLFHMFRTPSARLFNNKVVMVQSLDEAKESLKIIAETFKSAQEIMSLTLEIVEKSKLERRKHLQHPEVTDIHQQQQENSLAGIRLPRDVSTDLHSSTTSQDENLDTSYIESVASRDRCKMPGSQPRSKSPLSFLTNIPKPNMPSFSNKLNPAEINFSRPSGAKIGLQTKNLLRKITLPRRTGDFVEDEGHRSDSEVMKQTIRNSDPLPNSIHQEVEVNGVIFQSCGLLATSPKQLIRSSINLSTENRKRMSCDLEKTQRTSKPSEQSQSPPTASSSHKDQSMFSFDGVKSDVNEEGSSNTELSSLIENNGSVECHVDKVINEYSNTNHKETDTMRKEGDASGNTIKDKVTITLTQSDDDEDDKKTASDTEVESIDDSDNDQSIDDNNQIIGNDYNVKSEGDNDEEYCIIENEEVRAILKKCHQLQHPSMKVSLSDSSLSQTAAGQEQTEIRVNSGIDSNDSSLVSRFKMKISSLSKPSASKILEPPVHTKNHIRKSQRAMEVFEQLMKDKLPGQECKSRFIFI